MHIPSVSQVHSHRLKSPKLYIHGPYRPFLTLSLYAYRLAWDEAIGSREEKGRLHREPHSFSVLGPAAESLKDFKISATSGMKAIRYYGPGDVRLEDVPEPNAAPNQVKIKVAWNGICGSDVHAYLTRVPKIPYDSPCKITGEMVPVVMGHEFSGTITAVGKDVNIGRLSIGQNVVVEPVISCMEIDRCSACASGSRNICPEMNFIGIGGWGGGLAEYIAVKQEFVHALPQNIPLEIGAMVEPVAVAWHAAKRSNFKAGDVGLIIGGGPIGLYLLKILWAFGASKVYISEPTSTRRDLATRFGVTLAIDPVNADAAAVIMRETSDSGVDVVFDAAGCQSSLDLAVQAVKARGTIMNVAIWENSPRFPVNEMLIKEFIYTGCVGYDRVCPDVIDAIASGKLKGLEDLITRKIALEEVVEKGIRALIDEKDTQGENGLYHDLDENSDLCDDCGARDQ